VVTRPQTNDLFELLRKLKRDHDGNDGRSDGRQQQQTSNKKPHEQETRNGCLLIVMTNNPYKHAINPVSTS
jgi:hypothetical protein